MQAAERRGEKNIKNYLTAFQRLCRERERDVHALCILCGDVSHHPKNNVDKCCAGTDNPSDKVIVSMAVLKLYK